MAEEYIADVVRKGAKAIQRWRQAHPTAPVMLVGLDLSGLNLVGADLSRANMSGCNLHLTIMISADLSRAKLSGAKLRGANLVGANLSGANLEKAILTGAILQNANLEGADLGQANLRRADLRGALLRGANVEGADLQDAIITDAEYAQLQAEEAPPEEREDITEDPGGEAFALEVSVVISCVELARILQALDDIHVLLGLGPVRVQQAAINLGPGGPKNCLVVGLDPAAGAWLEESLGTRLEQLRSQEARILRYKKLGMTEQDVWHNVRPLLEDGSDPLGVLRDLIKKQVLLSYGSQVLAAPPGAQGTTAQAALDQVLGEPPQQPAAPAPMPQAPAPVPPAPAPAAPAPAPAAPEPTAPTPPAGGAVADDDVQQHVEQLESDDWSVRAAAAEALGNLGPGGQSAMPFLMKTVEDDNIFVREAAEDAIKKITGQG